MNLKWSAWIFRSWYHFKCFWILIRSPGIHGSKPIGNPLEFTKNPCLKYFYLAGVQSEPLFHSQTSDPMQQNQSQDFSFPILKNHVSFVIEIMWFEVQPKWNHCQRKHSISYSKSSNLGQKRNLTRDHSIWLRSLWSCVILDFFTF